MGGVGRLKAMLGAYQFVSLESGVKFRFKMCHRSNCVVINLNQGWDTYDIQFWKITSKGAKTVLVQEYDFVYADQLCRFFESFTGLRTSL